MTVIWRPHEGKQTFALRQRVFELLYGGARGGGKTEAGLVWLLIDINNPNYHGLVIRKNSNDLGDWIERSRRMYIPLGARFAGNPVEITFRSGAIIRTGHLKDENAYEKYQGHEYCRMLIEELTQIPTELDYLKLISSCRSKYPELKPRVFATTNPGGRGHAWVKKRFVDIGAPMKVYKDELTGRGRIYIPATVDDNPALKTTDPGYIAFLAGLPDKNLRDAWRYGRWDVFTGQFFGEWKDNIHVIPPFEIPPNWMRYISIDYGFAKPSAIYWHAIDPLSGKVYTYREIYVTEHTGEMLAKAVYAANNHEQIEWLIADNNIANVGKESGKSVLGQMKDVFEEKKWNIAIRLATKGPHSRVNGWNLFKGYIKSQKDERGYNKTRWQVFNVCPELIRTMPLQMYDETHVEDLDTDLEDHSQDSIRYFFTALNEIFEKKPPEPKPVIPKRPMNAEELLLKAQAEWGDINYINSNQ
ncbi:MAG: phage terminase large subunit [Patescibacteria group bacterium]